MFNVTFFWDITFYCYNLSWVSEISVFHVVSFNHFHLRYVAIYCVYLIGHFYLIYFRPFYLRHCRPLLSETFPASFIWDILSHFYLNTFQAAFISDILSHFLKTFHATLIWKIAGHPHAGQRRSSARMPQPIPAILTILTILQYGMYLYFCLYLWIFLYLYFVLRYVKRETIVCSGPFHPDPGWTLESLSTRSYWLLNQNFPIRELLKLSKKL